MRNVWLIQCDKQRYPGMEKYPDAILVFGNKSQAEDIAFNLSNAEADCTNLFYVNEIIIKEVL